MLKPANVNFDVIRGDDSAIDFAFFDENNGKLKLPSDGMWSMRIREKYEPNDEYMLQGAQVDNTVSFELMAARNIVTARYMVRHVAKNSRVTTYALGEIGVKGF